MSETSSGSLPASDLMPADDLVLLRRGPTRPAADVQPFSSAGPEARPNQAPEEERQVQCSTALHLAPSNDTEPNRRLALQKAAFVGAVWELATAKRISLENASHLAAARTENYRDLLDAGNGGESLLGQGRAYANYRSWSARLGRVPGSRKPDVDNWRALLPKYVGSRIYERPGDATFWSSIAKLYENRNQLSLQYCYRLVCLGWAHAHRQEPIPTYSQVRYYYDHHADRKAVAIARNGEEWFRNNLAGYIERVAPAVDECWFADHHIFDRAVRVRDEATGKWAAARPWITAWMDWGSLAFVGYVIRVQYPNRDSIERSLRIAIEGNGHRPPRHIYVDNGKDFSAQGFARPLSERDCDRLNSVASLLGVEVHFADPYNARAKQIERQFRVICEQFSKLCKSYRGSTPQDRPEEADRVWSNPRELPTLDEFVAQFTAWLQLVYHVTPSHGKVLAGKSPAEARRQAAFSRPALDAQTVYKAFLRQLPGPRRVLRGGVVRALRRHYRSDALWQLCDGQTDVLVKVDPDNISLVWVYRTDGSEVGPAEQVPSIPGIIESDADQGTIEQLREEIRRNRRQVREAKQASLVRRGVGRFLDAPESAGFLPAPAAPEPEPRRRAAASAKPQLPPADPTLMAALDQAIDEQTKTRLAELRDEPEPET